MVDKTIHEMADCFYDEWADKGKAIDDDRFERIVELTKKSYIMGANTVLTEFMKLYQESKLYDDMSTKTRLHDEMREVINTLSQYKVE